MKSAGKVPGLWVFRSEQDNRSYYRSYPKAFVPKIVIARKERKRCVFCEGKIPDGEYEILFFGNEYQGRMTVRAAHLWCLLVKNSEKIPSVRWLRQVRVKALAEAL